MTELFISALFFSGIHLLVSGTRLREVLVSRLGERPYAALFSLASAMGLAALVYFYSLVRIPQATALSAWRAAGSVSMLVAVALVVLGVTSRGPTAVGGESLLDQPDPARGIHRVTRHPMLWGFMLWAVTHMVFNPQPVNLVFFGTFLLTAAAGTASIDAKRRRKFGERWQRYEQQTSNLPLLAIAQGRNRWVPGEISLVKLAIAAGLFAGLLALHGRLFGLPACC